MGYDLILDATAGIDRIAFDLQLDFDTNQQVSPLLVRSDMLPKRRLMEIHLGLSELVVYPLNTLPTEDILRQKYPRIRSISIGLPGGYDPPEDMDAAVEFLETFLPTGFVTDPAYGLGVIKELRPMIAAIEELPGVVDIEIQNGIASHVDGTVFKMAWGDYEAIRLAFQRITRNYQQESLTDRTVLAYNSIPHRLRPADVPARSRPYKPGTIFKLLGGSAIGETILKGRDRKGLVDLLARNARAIADHDPQEFLQLQKDVELVSLDKLIDRFSHLLKSSHGEKVWQSLFELNPFILSMVFGYPVVLVAAGASVGGLTFTGQGTKIADFLLKNVGTHNAALVEIKTPQTELFGTEYRSGVWTPSRDVTGAIVQVLDQRAKFISNLPMLKHNSGVPLLQAHSVECVVVIGRTPDADAKRASLELMRTQLKDVRLVTSDELLGKLHLLRELLSGERYKASEDAEDGRLADSGLD